MHNDSLYQIHRRYKKEKIIVGKQNIETSGEVMKLGSY